MSRTGNSIFKRKDGRWEARYILSHDDFGRAIYKSVYAKTYNEAKEKRVALLKKAPQTAIFQVQCFSKLLDDWLHIKQTAVKPSTYIKYRNTINSRIMPALGDCDLSKITPKLFDAFYRKLLSDGLSANTVRGIAAILRNVIKYAQENEIISEFSLGQVRLPKLEKQISILSSDSQRRLTEHLINNPSRSNCGILLSLYLGLRIGELCALKVQDISMSDAALYVNCTLQRLQCICPSENKTQIVITSPKSSSSIRKIPLPEFLLPIISPFLHSGNAYFLSGTSVPIEPRVMENRLKALLKKHNIEQINFHALRHTFATRCVERGFDIKALSEILGHSSVKITLDRYVHPSHEEKKRCMNLLTDLLHSSSK